MLNDNLLTLIYFLPLIIVLIPYIRSVKNYHKLYREKKNPNFPLLGEAPAYFVKNPLNFIARLPLFPFIWWKIIFEKHNDIELNASAKKVRKLLLIIFLIILIDFLSFFLLVYFNFL